MVTGLATDASGIYVAVSNAYGLQGILRKYSPAGDELWSRTLTVFTVGGVAVDASGVYVACWDGPTSGSIRKYTSGGDELWIRQVDTGLVCQCNSPQGAVVADATGIYVVSAFVTKLGSSGNTLWKRQFPAAADGMNSVRVATLENKAAALDSTSLYVAGGTQRALPGQCKAGYGDVFVRKYNIADGTEQWTRQFGTRGYDFLGGIAVDASGVYVGGGIRGGPAHGNVFIAKLGKTPAPVASGRPQISQECVVNAASYVGGGVAPGEIVTVFGQAMGPAELTPLHLGDDGRLATTLSDTRVLFNGMAAPLLYVSATQSSAVVPYAIAGKPTVAVEIEYRGVRSDPLTLPVAPSRPGVFTFDGSGYGQGAILNEDGSLNSAANPADRGSIIVLYMTGEGLTDPASADGVIIGTTILKPRLPVSVWFEDPSGDGDNAEVLYAGAVQGSVAGLLQVNVRVPPWARSGSAVPFGVQIGAESAETVVTVALR